MEQVLKTEPFNNNISDHELHMLASMIWLKKRVLFEKDMKNIWSSGSSTNGLKKQSKRLSVGEKTVRKTYQISMIKNILISIATIQHKVNPGGVDSIDYTIKNIKTTFRFTCNYSLVKFIILWFCDLIHDINKDNITTQIKKGCATSVYAWLNKNNYSNLANILNDNDSIKTFIEWIVCIDFIANDVKHIILKLLNSGEGDIYLGIIERYVRTNLVPDFFEELIEKKKILEDSSDVSRSLYGKSFISKGEQMEISSIWSDRKMHFDMTAKGSGPISAYSTTFKSCSNCDLINVINLPIVADQGSGFPTNPAGRFFDMIFNLYYMIRINSSVDGLGFQTGIIDNLSHHLYNWYLQGHECISRLINYYVIYLKPEYTIDVLYFNQRLFSFKFKCFDPDQSYGITRPFASVKSGRIPSVEFKQNVPFVQSGEIMCILDTGENKIGGTIMSAKLAGNENMLNYTWLKTIGDFSIMASSVNRGFSTTGDRFAATIWLYMSFLDQLHDDNMLRVYVDRLIKGVPHTKLVRGILVFFEQSDREVIFAPISLASSEKFTIKSKSIKYTCNLKNVPNTPKPMTNGIRHYSINSRHINNDENNVETECRDYEHYIKGFSKKADDVLSRINDGQYSSVVVSANWSTSFNYTEVESIIYNINVYKHCTLKLAQDYIKIIRVWLMLNTRKKSPNFNQVMGVLRGFNNPRLNEIIKILYPDRYSKRTINNNNQHSAKRQHVLESVNSRRLLKNSSKLSKIVKSNKSVADEIKHTIINNLLKAKAKQEAADMKKKLKVQYTDYSDKIKILKQKHKVLVNKHKGKVLTQKQKKEHTIKVDNSLQKIKKLQVAANKVKTKVITKRSTIRR